LKGLVLPLGLLALAVGLVLHAMLPRYEVVATTTRQGAEVFRLDRITGEICEYHPFLEGFAARFGDCAGRR
jgi:hypothetical protein